MSTTIGIGYSSVDNTNLSEKIELLANSFGYGLLSGIGNAESDVKDGLEIAVEHEGWEHLLFLQSPRDSGASLAFGIHEELTALEMERKRPKFFDFLMKLSELCSGRCSKIGIFFSGEWYKEDRVRFSNGTVNDLISLLSMPGHWGMRYMIPETGHIQDSDEIPLLYDLEL